jgi:hypothetical protein
MAAETLFEDTEDGEGDVVEITGNFELQIVDTGGGTMVFQKALGPGSSESNLRTVEEFNGPAHRIIENPNTSRFRIILSNSIRSGTKLAEYQATE